jgi:hypothetical protein
MEDPEGLLSGLRPIQLADKRRFNLAFSHLAEPLSDYTFANTYTWGLGLRCFWGRIDRHVCVFANSTGDLSMLMPPLPETGAGERDLRDCIGRCFEQCLSIAVEDLRYSERRVVV